MKLVPVRYGQRLGTPDKSFYFVNDHKQLLSLHVTDDLLNWMFPSAVPMLRYGNPPEFPIEVEHIFRLLAYSLLLSAPNADAATGISRSLHALELALLLLPLPQVGCDSLCRRQLRLCNCLESLALLPLSASRFDQLSSGRTQVLQAQRGVASRLAPHARAAMKEEHLQGIGGWSPLQRAWSESCTHASLHTSTRMHAFVISRCFYPRSHPRSIAPM